MVFIIDVTRAIARRFCTASAETQEGCTKICVIDIITSIKTNVSTLVLKATPIFKEKSRFCRDENVGGGEGFPGYLCTSPALSGHGTTTLDISRVCPPNNRSSKQEK